MGTVYAATHVGLRRPVALKVMAPELVGEPVLVQRFLREARAAARIRHDHIINVFDVGIDNDLPYLAMELLDGESLGRRFGRGVVETEELVGIMLPVLAAVGTAHEAGIIHRDLKPENVFLSRDTRGQMRPVVLDFGISKIADEAAMKLTDTQAVMGTPHYMSPEQAIGARNVTGATDQYAVGVIMYEGAVGKRPFTGNSLLEIFQDISKGIYVPPRRANPAVPSELARIIERAMAREANARYPNLWHLGRVLLPLASRGDQETWQKTFWR
jgi:serine/threonine-protein kinase